MEEDAVATTPASMGQNASVESKEAVAAVLARLHPETWEAVCTRFARQTDVWPTDMAIATEPAYRYIPDAGGA